MNLNIHRTVMRIFLCILNVRVGELSERGGTASVRRQCSPPFLYTVLWNITVLLLCIADPKIDITSDVTLWGFSPGKVLFYITGRVNILNVEQHHTYIQTKAHNGGISMRLRLITRGVERGDGGMAESFLLKQAKR